MARSAREIEREGRYLERTASVVGSIPGIRSIFGKRLDKRAMELEAEAEALEEAEARKPTLSERALDSIEKGFKDAGMTYRASDKTAFFQRFTHPVTQPKFLEGKFQDVTRLGQWAAALSLLPFIIIISLTIDVAAMQVIADVFLNDSIIPADQLGIMQFIATMIGLGLFTANIWFWFLFVKTGGFGIYEL